MWWQRERERMWPTGRPPRSLEEVTSESCRTESLDGTGNRCQWGAEPDCLIRPLGSPYSTKRRLRRSRAEEAESLFLRSVLLNLLYGLLL